MIVSVLSEGRHDPTLKQRSLGPATPVVNLLCPRSCAFWFGPLAHPLFQYPLLVSTDMRVCWYHLRLAISICFNLVQMQLYRLCFRAPTTTRHILISFWI